MKASSKPTSLAICDATEIARRIRDGEISAEACLDYFLKRVERFDGDINAFVALDEERARTRAREADRALAAGEVWGPLHGVPMSIKEAFDMEGLPTTWGDPAYADNVATADSFVATRLRAAGAVLFGKTNVPIRLADFQTYNEIYGTTNSPWDLTRTPGGSSGGESAALAAGLTALGLGSDIGSSIRNPAHYAGVFGHKTTYGIIRHHGHGLHPLATAEDLGVFGPMARSARDLRLVLELVAGPGPLDGRGWRLSLPEPQKALRELRVVVWANDAQAPVDSEIAARCRKVGEALAGEGATVSEDARPDIDLGELHSCYMKLLASALVHQRPREAFEEACRVASRFDPADTSDAARGAWNVVMPHRTWLELHELRTQFRHRWRAFFDAWDVVIAPVARTPAFAHDHRPFHERTMVIDGSPAPYFQQLFWAGLATACYLPATAIPTGVGSAGLPIGVQLIGAEFDDLRTIDVAGKLEALGFAFQPPPGYED